jgi:hypothetical protein
MSDIPKKEEYVDLAERIRDACLKAAREGFRDALMSGLCSEGAMEAAISSMQKLDLEKIIQKK